MLWLDFTAEGFKNTGIGGNICAAELVAGFENIGQRRNLFLFPLLLSLSLSFSLTHIHTNTQHTHTHIFTLSHLSLSPSSLLTQHSAFKDEVYKDTHIHARTEWDDGEGRKEGRKDVFCCCCDNHIAVYHCCFSRHVHKLCMHALTQAQHTHAQSPHLFKCRLDPTIPFPADFHRMHTHRCYLHMPLQKKKVEHEVRKEKRRRERRSRDKTVWKTLISSGSLFKCSPQALMTVI